MTDPDNAESVTVRLARSPAEIEAAQRLRFAVFYDEYGAVPTEDMARLRRDFDSYDGIADHLIVIDESRGHSPEGIIGTYRLLRREIADRHGQFYTSGEFDISPLLNCGESLLELGRSCVLATYRTRPVLQKLWQGIADYVMEYNIGLMFGCASLPGTNTDALAEELAYLYHHHLAPASLRPVALTDRYVNMNSIDKSLLDIKDIFQKLPPLVKGYLRVGATIGDGAVIDRQFNTTDVCIVLPTELVTSRYKKHYERTTGRTTSRNTGNPPPLTAESA